MTPRIQIPSVQQIVDLHDRIVSEVGGARGIRSTDAIAGAWGRAEARIFYGEVDVWGAAATLAVSVAKAHGFADGNKRAAYGAMALTLALNGRSFELTPVAAVDLIVAAATGDGAPEALADALRAAGTVDPVYPALFRFDLGQDLQP